MEHLFSLASECSCRTTVLSDIILLYYYLSYARYNNIIGHFECKLNVTCTYRIGIIKPHEYYMILPALGISAASVTTIYMYTGKPLALHCVVLQT